VNGQWEVELCVQMEMEINTSDLAFENYQTERPTIWIDFDSAQTEDEAYKYACDEIYSQFTSYYGRIGEELWETLGMSFSRIESFIDFHADEDEERDG